MDAPREINSLPVFPAMGLAWGLVGIGLVAAGMLQNNPHWAIAAVPAIALAWGLFLFRPPTIAGRLDEDALVLTAPQVTIPYDWIESITLAGFPQDIDGKLRRGPIVVVHPHGILTIPARLNCPVEDLYRELLQRTETSGSRDVHSELKAHLDKELEIFGEDHVWTFRARKGHVGRSGNRQQLNCFILLMLAGLFWIVAPFVFLDTVKSLGSFAWVGFGIALALISLLGALGNRKSSVNISKLVPRWQVSSLVVSPSGVAMIQGDLRGHMRWDELREARMGARKSGFTFAEANQMALIPSMHLLVAGAVVRIYDLYDRPLPTISKIVRQTWLQPVPAKDV